MAQLGGERLHIGNLGNEDVAPRRGRGAGTPTGLLGRPPLLPVSAEVNRDKRAARVPRPAPAPAAPPPPDGTRAGGPPGPGPAARRRVAPRLRHPARSARTASPRDTPAPPRCPAARSPSESQPETPPRPRPRGPASRPRP